MFKQLKKYIIIYGLFVKNCLIAQMEYRINFLMSVLIECAFVFAKMIYVIVVFKAGVAINGLTPYAILMFIGSYTIITGVMDAVYFVNVTKLPEYVRNGTLDIFITKPLSLQFAVSFRYFDFGLAVPNIIAGVTMVVVSWVKLGLAVNLLQVGGYLLFTLIGIVMTYPLLMFPYIFSFWIVKTQSLYDIVFALWDFNNMPMGIYSKWLQRFGIFILPIFLITNFAPMFVMGMIGPGYFVWALIAPFLFLFLLRKFWKFAIKNYSSASS